MPLPFDSEEMALWPALAEELCQCILNGDMALLDSRQLSVLLRKAGLDVPPVPRGSNHDV